MKFRETFNFLEVGLRPLWGKFELLSVMKKFLEKLENIEVAYRNQYSEASDEILEYGKNFQQFLENFGEILLKCKS